MDDLQSYRARIGLFCGGLWKDLKVRSHFVTQSKVGIMTYLLTFLCVGALVKMETMLDPSIERNPGPSQEYSKAEFKVVNKIKAVNKDIGRISSHRYYLTQCIDMGVVPKGLRREVSNCIAKPNVELKSILEEAEREHTLSNMRIFKEHYDLNMAELEQLKTSLVLQLQEVCSNRDRFNQIMDDISSRWMSDIETLQARKAKKLNRDMLELQGRKDWLPDLGLSTTERSYIENGEDLCDAVINAASRLITKNNPLLDIQSVTFNEDHLIFNPLETVHVHHNGQHHFLVSSSIGGTIRIFDSLNQPMSDSLHNQIRVLYSPDRSITPEIQQVVMPVKQAGTTDCGLFAIAYATELSLGNDPSEFIFDQSSMRQHLLKCLEARNILPFQKLNKSTKGKAIEVTKELPRSEKWTKPAKVGKLATSPRVVITPVSNKFSALDIEVEHNTEKSSKTKSKKERSKHSPREEKNEKSSNKSTTHSRKKPQTTSSVINFSQRFLTKEELEVLDLGLTFCPSAKSYSKEQLSEDFCAFFRRLKLTEFFFQKKQQQGPDKADKNNEDRPTESDDDQCKINWSEKIQIGTHMK